MAAKLTRQAICAKENARAQTAGASADRELASKLAEFPEFAWLGEQLVGVPRFRLQAAVALVQLHGDDPRSPEVSRALGISEHDAREQARVADVQRRAKRAVGDAPPGKALEERTKYVAVKILVAFFVRLKEPTPLLADGTKVNATGAALLARAGMVPLPGQANLIEQHPRAMPRQVRKLEGSRKARVEAELAALELGKFGPGESNTPLPDGVSCATRRNRRRAAEARAQYEEQRVYERQQRLERLAARAGGRLRNPAGVKPLPLQEGRKARRVAWERDAALRFLMGLPHGIRVRLFDAATKGGERGRFSEEARTVYAFYAFLLWTSEAPRPVMRRAGFDRAVEGLPREALAVSFVWNSFTSAPYHANTISALAKSLEEAGLLLRESPNGQDDVYTGVTGWALYVYRVRNAEQLGELLKALGEVDAGAVALGRMPAPILAGDAAS